MSALRPTDGARRPGAPLAMLAILLSAWIGVRLLIWGAPLPDAAGQIGLAVPALSARANAAHEADNRGGDGIAPRATRAKAPAPPAKTATDRAAPDAGPVAPVPAAGVSASPLIWNGPAAPPLGAASQAAAGHQLLWLAAMSHQPEPAQPEPASSEVGLAGDNR